MYDAKQSAAFERQGTRYVRHYGHVHDNVIMFEDGTVAATIALGGYPFELSGNAGMNGVHGIRSEVFRNTADEDVAFYEHQIQHDGVAPFPAVVEHQTFYGRELQQDYDANCLKGLKAISWFSTIMISPRGINFGWRQALGLQPGSKQHAKARQPGPARQHRIARLMDRVATCMRAYQGLAPRLLGVRVEDDVCFSEIAEAHRMVLYCKWAPVPMIEARHGGLGAAIYTDRIITSTAGFRIETPGRADELKPHGTMIGKRIYNTRWKAGMFDRLMGLPFNYVMTNSYRMQGRTKAGDNLASTARHMDNAGDRAETLREELDEVMDAVDRGEHVMGEHLWSLAIHSKDMASLERDASDGRSAVGACGVVHATEDLGMEAAFWAQMPGSPLYLRARAGNLPSIAFAAMSSLHAHPTGEERHHWGRPLYRVRTTANTAYDVPWHLRDVGHRARLAPTGSGKTLDMGFEAAMLDPLIRAKGGSQIFFDKDNGNETLVRAMGGPVAALRRGHSDGSGMAPLLGLPSTPASLAWIHEFLAGLILDDGRGSLTPEDDLRMQRGIAFIMAQPLELRREVGGIAGVREFMTHEDPLSGGARLERWCRGGSLGWAFDGREDWINFDCPMSSVDPSRLLKDAAVMPPTAAYLLHRADLIMDGRPVVLHADEFRSYLPDSRMVNGVEQMRFAKGFEDFALTGRKKNWSLDLATQQPEHILQHPVGPSIMAQCKTRVFYRNPDADPHWYINGMGCSPRIWKTVKTDMRVGAPSKIIQREGYAVRCVMDLSVIPQHIPMLSTNDQTLPVLHEAIAEYGPDPAQWIGPFRTRLKEKGLTP